MDQLGSWFSYLTAVIFGLLAWTSNDWSLSTALLIVPVLAVTAIAIGLFLQSPR
jgi:hypothetical protein